MLVGEIGLILLLLGAGIELDVEEIRQTGTRAVAIAFVGSMLPLVSGIGFAYITDSDLGIKGALAVGAAFAPTSSGVAVSALSTGGIYNTPVGRLIMASCVVDDIIGLILLSTFQVLCKDEAQIIEYFIPLISSCAFLIVLGLPAVSFLPRFIEKKFLPMFSKPRRDMAMFGLLVAMCMAYLQMLNYSKASYLTGAFLAGASFSQVDGAYEKFKKGTDSIMQWLLRIFFTATIGFQVPIELFRHPTVLGMGFGLWASCVAIKSLVAFFVPRFEESEKGAIYDPYKRDVLVTGLSMTCRGELNFIIAAFALSEGVIDPKMYGAMVLAVLLSAVTSPFMLLRGISHFKSLYQKQLTATDPQQAQKSGNTKPTMPLHLHIHLETKGAWSLLERLQTEIRDLDLVVEDYRTTHTRGLDPTIINDIYVRDTKTEIAVPTATNQKALNETMHSYDVVSSMRSNKTNSLQDLAEMETLSEDERKCIIMIAKQLEEEAHIETREKEIQAKLYQSMKESGITVLDVQQWNPWDWTAVLDTMTIKRVNGEELSLEFFMKLFDIVDTDGSGTFNEDDLSFVLNGAGMNVTRERLTAMIAVVDEDGDGQISRDEWVKAIQPYLDKKKHCRTMSLDDLSALNPPSLRDRLGSKTAFVKGEVEHFLNDSFIGTDSDDNDDDISYDSDEGLVSFPIKSKETQSSSDASDLA